MNFLQDEQLSTLQRAYGCRCTGPVFFANSYCLRCDTPLGYEPFLGRVLPLVPGPQFGTWYLAETQVSAGKNDLYRRCANLNTPAACNWVVNTRGNSDIYCIACRLNRTIPNLSSPVDAMLWGRIEAAKRRVLAAIVGLGLPLASRLTDDPQRGLAFDFLRSPQSGPRVLTGHEDGLITLNIEEADDVTREQMRASMHEPYRTLVGHFRHEIGHYYWDRLVDGSSWLEGFRRLFGDERSDYAESVKLHYEYGPKPGWTASYVSAYASVHPWEDWAETWAHYMHMVDTLGTAAGFGLCPESMALPFECFGKDTLYSPDAEDSDHFLEFVNSWLKLGAVMNEICRSMGQPDFYPFALPAAAVTKLHFVHLVVRHASRKSSEAASSIWQSRCA